MIMREIKFKGYSKELKKWFIGALDNSLNWADFIIVHENGFGIKYRIDSETIGQFTGLKDINGTEIYEGDIFHCNKVNYMLRFNQLGGAYTVHKITDEKDERFLFHCNDQIEVIGNIHENPELLCTSQST